MHNFGIVCEFNPFHNGHKRLFDEARRMGAQRTVCVMSGNAVQRGELACADKYIRAEAALREGADLVLELPYPWCAASAEHFARAAIYVLSHFCDTVIFGSESGDAEYIKAAANICASESFRAEYKTVCESGCGSAEGYVALLKKHGFEGLSSNDMLGIEYIKAASRMGSDIDFLTVKREGAAYNSEGLDEYICPSATALRRSWRDTGVEATEKYLPKYAFEIYKLAEKEGRLTDMCRVSNAILLYLRLAGQQEDIADTEGGLQNRIASLAAECTELEEFFGKLYTKRYTDAKLRRSVLFSLTHVKKELLFDYPRYTLLLGANANGRELLSAHRRREGIQVITKPSDAPADSEQFKVGESLEAIFTLARKKKEPQGAQLKRNAVII